MSEHQEHIADELERIRHAESIGDFLSAFEQAARAVESHPKNEELKYLAVRAIARAGSPGRAEELYNEFDLHSSDNVDVAALEARIAKDRYLQSGYNPIHATRSAEIYERVFNGSNDYFPGINAATMWALAGDRDKSKALAERVQEICTVEEARANAAEFWLLATKVEAALLLGGPDAARKPLSAAVGQTSPGLDAVASTVRQLKLICSRLGLDDTFLELFVRPKVAFFSGHIIAAPGKPGRFPADREASVAEGIRQAFEREDIRFGYGSLAAGADILFAEALLSRGGELHIVLPFELEEFKSVSIASSGAIWLRRFDDCLRAAASVSFATTGAYLGHDILFGYTANVAMGLARIRARALETEAEMFAVWDGEKTGGHAGTSADLAYWRARDLKATIIPSGPTLVAQVPVKTSDGNDLPRRFIGPVLFADVKGFSKIEEERLPAFSRHVFGPLGDIIRTHGDHVLFTNTWGDAVHVVFSDAVAGARCALAMQRALGAIDFAAFDLPEEIGMRVSLHVGPVFEGYDPINEEETYYGQTLTRAARMEPITPIGEVYVTEQYAALIEMQPDADFRCNYVGDVPLAKDFGSLRMYRLVEIKGETTTSA